jgi:thymidylate kinase
MLITFEGPDGVGKSTQSVMLCDELVRQGFRATRMAVPIRPSLTQSIQVWMLSYGWALRLPRTFQLLILLNKLLFQWFSLSKLLRDNDFVILDRWDASALVFGLASGLHVDFVKYTYLPLRRPDLTFVLMGRAHADNDALDSYESNVCLQLRARQLYVDWVDSVDQAFRINANTSIDAVHSVIVATLAHRCPELNISVPRV